MLLACKKDPIPVVTVNLLPAELAYHSDDTLFDTIPYQIIEILRDTISPDSIEVDTLKTDTFRLDTFFVDSVRLKAAISYEGDQPFGPALQEYGFCLNEHQYLPIAKTEEPKTPASTYDTFSCVIPARHNYMFYVHAYAINPFGEVRSETKQVNLSTLDPR